MPQENILIVDDEKNIRLMLRHCLEGNNYIVDTAVNGEDALDKLKEKEFDLILLDMKLPGMSGMEVLQWVSFNKKNTGVIMITAFGTIESAVEAMKMGAFDYLRKPFSTEEIRRLVQEVLERRTLKEEDLDSFQDILQFAKKCIVERNFQKALGYLHKAISEESTKPEPFNLLGILNEVKGNKNEAQKMYRVALALDPTYGPAESNLRRTAQFLYQREQFDFGDKSENQP
ncbi:response regulator [Candidatus Contubernalis alkaliaceticus]|uniref:response regulator n=1 Tax=Candidatus Contubernalis alkaliaceticus TaxID=338645 RepID=UPI001F4C372F|nr:response regulator [Candidatus Contubernalis alkalaceticus]UNC92256.1 response regulator [Candidatus Contubernalis alkalaceticus]